jgi:hypothetical protein
VRLRRVRCSPACLLRLGRDGDLGTLFLYDSVSDCPCKVWKVCEPRSLMFMTPGALDVVLRFLPSSRPATAESTFLRSDVSADIVLR